MPLPRVQVVGASEERFIYQVGWTRDHGVSPSAFRRRDFDNAVRFVGSAAEHLVRLAGVLRPILQREWAAMVARLNDLPESRLEEHLFGASRRASARLVADLRDLQGARCFYCGERLASRVQADHFVPWARHPDDSIENLVAVDGACNRAKSGHLAALEHVAAWVGRGRSHAADLADLARHHGWERGGDRAEATARGVYDNLAPAVPLWLIGGRFVPLERAALARVFG
jgi:hypothetical protein